MSFTSYATAVAGSILTASWLNTYVRDNGNEILGGLVGTGFTAFDLLGTGTPPSVSGASHAKAYYDTTIDAVMLSSNGGAYAPLGNNTLRLAADFSKTNNTLADITGFSRNVLAGKTYRFRAVLIGNLDVGGGGQVAIGGTCTATEFAAAAYIISDGVSNRYSTTGTKGTAMAGFTGGTGTFFIEGSIVVNAAGTLTVQFSQSVSSGTSAIVKGSTFTLY
jgi:hypothetical protein